VKFVYILIINIFYLLNYQKYGRFISFRIIIEAGRDHRVQM